MQDRIKRIIGQFLDELADAERVWRPEWIAKAVLKRFEHVLRAEPGESEAAEFWRHCGYREVRRMVAEAIRRRTRPGDDPDQLPFPEFPRVQAYYDIKRNEEWVGVPVLQLTSAERRSKVEELRQLGHALLEHADQLEAFYRTQGAA